MLISLLVAGLLGLGIGAAFALATWAIACLAQWVFGLFTDKDPDVDTNITIKDPEILGEVVEEIKKKNRELGNRLEGALLGGEPKAISVFTADGECREVCTLKAEDATVDEIGDDILRMERYTKKVMKY